METLNLEYKQHFGIQGQFLAMEAFKGIRVVTIDPLNPNAKPDLEKDPYATPILSVLEFPNTRRKLMKPGPNRLLISGMDGPMTERSDWMTYCQVGDTGTPRPSSSDTALQGWVAGTNTIEGTDVTTAQPSPPYYMYRRRTYRFAEGVAEGNLREVGVGWAGTAGSNIICRHLTVNESGQAADITVLSNEWLDVVYELRYYPPLNDVDDTTSLTLNGVPYTTKTRASQVTTSFATRIGTGLGQYSASTSDWLAYDNEIQSITETPTGNSAACDNANQSNETYQAGTFQRVMVCNTGTTGWNLGAGIRSIRISTTAGNFQTRFGSTTGDNTIPKDSGYTMQLKWTLSWAEYLTVSTPTAVYALTGVDATLTKV